MADNVAFCYPNWTMPSAVVTPTITGAGWIDLGKLQGDILSEMARYPGVTLADTKFRIDLGTDRNIDVLALPFHNAKPGDLAKAVIYSDAGYSSVLHDTGWIEFFGEVYPYGTLEWGHVSWLDGRLTEEQAAGKMPPWWALTGSTVVGRYIEWSFDFTGNTDGFVDAGRPFVSPIVRPVYNVSYGVSPPFYRDPSIKRRTRAGTQFKEKHRKYLACRMTLDYLSEDELYGQFYEMVREYGVTEPFFFIYNSAAADVLLDKQCFVATAEKVGEPSNPDPDIHSMTIEICQEF